MTVTGAQVLVGNFVVVLTVSPTVVIVMVERLHVGVVGVGVVRVWLVGVGVGVWEAVRVVRLSVQLVEVGLLKGIAVEDPLQSTKTVVFEVIVIIVVSMWPVASLWAREKRLLSAVSV